MINNADRVFVKILREICEEEIVRNESYSDFYFYE